MNRLIVSLIIVVVFTRTGGGNQNMDTGIKDPLREDPIILFARDFSSNDEAIVAEARRYLAHPPTDEETIGFYGSRTYAPRTRVFLATVSLLDNRGKLDSVEDKYTRELLVRWQTKGVIDAAALPPAAKAVFGPFLGAGLRTRIWSRKAYREKAWTLYAKATAELEQQIAARGKALLSIDATDGDTLFFAVVDPEVGARWRDKALSEEDGYFAGVRSPMWDRFWDHLSDSTDLLDDEGRRGYPPGTRTRVPALPLAECRSGS